MARLAVAVSADHAAPPTPVAGRVLMLAVAANDNGQIGYTTPTLLSIGTGSAPYRLDYGLSFKAAPSACNRFGPCTGPITGGWNQTWDVRFSNSGSGLEAMGRPAPIRRREPWWPFWPCRTSSASLGLPISTRMSSPP